MQINPPYLMFLGDVPDPLAAKTAYGIVDWRRDWCLGQLRLRTRRGSLPVRLVLLLMHSQLRPRRLRARVDRSPRSSSRHRPPRRPTWNHRHTCTTWPASTSRPRRRPPCNSEGTRNQRLR